MASVSANTLFNDIPVPGSEASSGGPPTISASTLFNDIAVPGGAALPSGEQSLTNTPPEYTGWDRPLSLMRNAAVHGAADLIGMAGWPIRALVAAKPGATSEDITSANVNFPSSLDVQDWAGKHGLLSQEQVSPQGPMENALAGATSGVVSTLPLLPFGPEGLVAKGALLGQGAAGGMLGAIAPDNPSLQLLAGAVPAGGIETLAQMGIKREAQAAAKAVGQDAMTTADLAENAAMAAKGHFDATKALAARTVQDLTALGTAPQSGLVAQTTRAANDLVSQTAQQSGQLKDQIIAAAQARAQQVKATADAAGENVAKQYGTSTTPESAGEVGQREMRNWVNVIDPQVQQHLFDHLDAAVPQAMPVGDSNWRQAIKQLNSVVDPEQAASFSRFTSPTVKGLAQDLAMKDAGAATENMPLPQESWQSARAFRSAIGDTIGSPKLAGDMTDDTKRALYAAKTADMREALASQHPELLPTYDQALGESQARYDFRDNVGKKIIAGPQPSLGDPLPGKVAGGLLAEGQVDDRTLQALRLQVPNFANELAATAIRTGKWNDLVPGAKQALVPDPIHRGLLDAAEQAKNLADQHISDVTDAAKQAHQETLAQVKTTKAQMLDTVKGGLAVALSGAKQQGEQLSLEAKANAENLAQQAIAARAKAQELNSTLAPGPKAPDKVSKFLTEHLGSMAFGGLLGEGANSFHPMLGSLEAAGAGALGAMALPYLGRALRAPITGAIKNPLGIGAAALGASNSLFPQAGGRK